ncbi:alpha/beta fold hydrolase [Martelella sp. HB161492]|uniref:alpha/beta hydrolase n=1 Tax=Martelella sp. HB161492 TaxID=2720726 RepID=UPI00159247CF|nr:alpha/beta fold hydrolase [Martelella sp. HB161492]
MELILLHGSAGGPADWGRFAEAIAPDARHILPVGALIDGAGFTFLEKREDGRGFDRALAADRARALMAQLPGGGSEPSVLVGYSRGAVMAQALLSLAPARFSGAILLRPEPLTDRFPVLETKPVLLLAGREDSRRRLEDAERLAAALGNAGADVDLMWLDSGHGWAPAGEDTSLARDWLRRKFG